MARPRMNGSDAFARRRRRAPNPGHSHSVWQATPSPNYTLSQSVKANMSSEPATPKRFMRRYPHGLAVFGECSLADLLRMAPQWAAQGFNRVEAGEAPRAL